MLLDEELMLAAIEQAKIAAELGEVPVGAVVADNDGKIIAAAHNLRETRQSPTAHAEILAIEKAAGILNTWRLSDCTIYVTLEPCPMCAGAIINARLKRLVYGAFDDNMGACASVINLFECGFATPQTLVRSRILLDNCAQLMTDFFKKLR